MAKKVKKMKVLRSGTKIEAFLNWLKKWAIKGKFVFTSEHAEIVKKELGLPRLEAVWHMLQTLERRGFIKRKKRNGVNGIRIVLAKGKPTPKSAKTISTKIPKTKKRRTKKSSRHNKTVRKVSNELGLTVVELADREEENLRVLEVIIAEKKRLITWLRQENSGVPSD